MVVKCNVITKRLNNVSKFSQGQSHEIQNLYKNFLHIVHNCPPFCQWLIFFIVLHSFGVKGEAGRSPTRAGVTFFMLPPEFLFQGHRRLHWASKVDY
jgi:hypothetical protein